MEKEFDSKTKLGEIYKNLCGVHLTVEDMDLPVRVYNYLKRAGVNTLQQILLMSEDDLINAGIQMKFSQAPRSCAYILFKLEELSKESWGIKIAEKYCVRKKWTE